jgi:hypothetical protein
VSSVLRRRPLSDRSVITRRAHSASAKPSFPQRAAELREARGTRWLAVCALAVVVAATLALSPEPQPQLAPLAVIAALLAGWRARRQFSLARRAGIGARSEQLVDGVLGPLRTEDWEIRTNVRWPGNGDVDVVAIAPGGPTFVIETKTRRYTAQHVRRTARAARLFTAGIPVLVTAVPGKLRIEEGVSVCGRERLVPFLRECTADYHRRLAESVRRRALA